MSEKLVKLRFIDHVVNADGEFEPHPTKPGALARHGGQIPLIDKETGFPKAVLPGEMFEVEKSIADELIGARPGVIILESEYAKRRVRAEARYEADDPRRNGLAVVYRRDAAAREARAKLAQKVEAQRIADLQVGSKVAAPGPDITMLFAEMEKRQQERDRVAADRIADLERRLAVQIKPEEKTETPVEKVAEQPKSKKDGKA